MNVKICVDTAENSRVSRFAFVEAAVAAAPLVNPVTKFIKAGAIDPTIVLAKRARVFGLKVEDGEAEGLSIRTWSYVPGSAGRISFVSFRIPELFEGEKWTSFLKEWSSYLPRCPWKWSFWERSTIGYLLPEFKKSRVAFSREGVGISKWESTMDD